MGRQLQMGFMRRKKSKAGRKPHGAKAGISHLRRPALRKPLPVHVTLRMRPHVYNLRSKRCFLPIQRAFFAVMERPGFRLNQFSVQGNHIHLIVEAHNNEQLSRGIQSLEIRIAKRLNTVMQRRGRVFADRYHAHLLRTPTEVRNALRYVIDNHRKHYGSITDCDPYSSAAENAPISAAETWLLRSARAAPS